MRPRFAMISANGGHQERRARANANGEELERYQSLDWRAQGWTMNDDELRKNGENMAQPTSLYVNSSPPAKRPSRGPWAMARSAKRKSPPADAAKAADRNTPALNVRGSAEMGRMGCRKGGCRAFSGREQCGPRVFPGPSAGASSASRPFTPSLGCSRR
jgi:hypothetical protein